MNIHDITQAIRFVYDLKIYILNRTIFSLKYMSYQLQLVNQLTINMITYVLLS